MRQEIFPDCRHKQGRWPKKPAPDLSFCLCKPDPLRVPIARKSVSHCDKALRQTVERSTDLCEIRLDFTQVDLVAGNAGHDEATIELNVVLTGFAGRIINFIDA